MDDDLSILGEIHFLVLTRSASTEGRGTSSEYPQLMFSGEMSKSIC